MSEQQKQLQEEMNAKEAIQKQKEMHSLRMRARLLQRKLEVLEERQQALLLAQQQEEPSETKDEKEMGAKVLKNLNQEIAQIREAIVRLEGNTAEVPDS